MARVTWTPQAIDDLGAICTFISRDSPTVARIFANRVFRATDHLEDQPRMGRRVPELGVEAIREIVLSNYRIIYRIHEEELQILTVHHGARLLDSTRFGDHD